MSHDKEPGPGRIEPTPPRNPRSDRSDVDLDLDLRVQREVPVPVRHAVPAGPSAQELAEREAAERAAKAVARAKEIDREVGQLLDRLDGVIGPSRRMALSNLLTSGSLREALADRMDTSADHSKLLTPADLESAGRDLRAQRDHYDDRIFKFGIVGFQSSGKSYLISALFDQLNFLPSLDEATTSVVTRIRYPFKNESTDVITVLFHDEPGKREFIEFLNRINATERLTDPIRYVDHPGEALISADYAAKDFFLKCNNPRRDLPKYRLISEVHILKDSPFLTDYTEIIDLPGLGGPYALLDDTTLSYLDEVDAVLFISSVNHNWVAKDTEIFRAFASRPNVFRKVFFVLSKLDMPGSELEKSIHTFHSLLDEFVGPELPRDRVFYCSAWMALHNRLQNRAQIGNLDNIRGSFDSQDPASFFRIRDESMHRKLRHTFTPQDGGVKVLRDGLYNFFSTHKRLLQLDEVLDGLTGMIGRTGDKMDGMLDLIGHPDHEDAATIDRELHWIERRQQHMLEEARQEMSSKLANGNGNGNGNGHSARESLFKPWTTDRIATHISNALPRLLRQAGLPESPERRRERREAAVALAPMLGHDLATAICEDRAPVLAERFESLMADRIESWAAAFPDGVRSALTGPLAGWGPGVHAALRAILGPRLLAACRPAEGAAEEMDPFIPEFRRFTADSVRSTLDRMEGEWPGALVAAWDTLRVGMHQGFDRDVRDFYREHPDAPRPMVDSPEALLHNLQRVAAELAACLDTARSLDKRVTATLDSLK
ncbi:MAG: dynamin family protein [Planctomycetota bacterium]